jgi:POT family
MNVFFSVNLTSWIVVFLFLYQRWCNGRSDIYDCCGEGLPCLSKQDSVVLIPLQYDGFYLAFTLPTAVFLLCPIVLFFGRNMYRRYPPQGSVFVKSIKLWSYAARGRWSLNPITLYKNLKADDFWESAKPSNIPDGQRPVWMTFDDKWVEEVRRGFKACAVFLWYPLYCTSSDWNGNWILRL